MSKIFNRYSQKELRNGLRHKMTPHEIILWSKLKNSQLHNCKFRRQHGIGRFIVDFYCPELKLVIEVDGANHFFDEESEKYDNKRQKFIESQGIKVIRVGNTDIKDNMSGVLDLISQEIFNRKSTANHP